MTDFAKLILTADASGLKQGEAALDSIAAKGEQTEKRVTDAMDKTGKSATGAGDKFVELGKGATSARAPLDALGASVFPSINAGAQKVVPVLTSMPDKIKEVGKEADKAAREIRDDLTPALSALGRDGAAAGTAAGMVFKPFKKGLDEAGKSAKVNGQQIQNASFQVADFFVQVESGTPIARALGQQLPQLLGGFGALGAVLGAGVAIGGTFVPMLFDTVDGAKALKTALDDLNNSVADYKAAAQVAGMSTKDLDAQFGAMSAQALRASETLKTIAKLDAADALDTAISGLTETFGGLSRTAQVFTRSGGMISEIDDTFANLRGELNLTDVQAATTIGSLERLANAKTMDEQVRAAADFSRALELAFGSLDDVPPALRDIAKQTAQMALSAGEIVDESAAANALLAEQRAYVGDMVASLNQQAEMAALVAKYGSDSVQVTEARVQAERDAMLELLESKEIGGELADELLRAWDNANGVASVDMAGNIALARSEAEALAYTLATMPGASMRELDDGRGSQREGLRDLAEWRTDEWLRERREAEAKAKRDALKKPRSGGRGKSGGSGRTKVTPDEKWGDDVAEYQRQTEAFLAQADALAKVTAAGGDWERALAVIEEEQQLLNAAQKAGIELTPEIRAGIKGMAEDYIDAEEKLEQMRGATERGQDAMRDLFGSMIDGAGSTKEALASLLAEIAKVQFAKGAMGLLGQTSWGSGLVQGIGNLLSFDGGGYTGDGARSGGLDGKGGFLAMMHPNETVTDHTKGQGGATSVHVTVGMDESGNLQVRKIAQQEAASMGQAVSASIPGRIQQYSANPRRR